MDGKVTKVRKSNDTDTCSLEFLLILTGMLKLDWMRLPPAPTAVLELQPASVDGPSSFHTAPALQTNLSAQKCASYRPAKSEGGG